jgi:hypothetical protein
MPDKHERRPRQDGVPNNEDSTRNGSDPAGRTDRLVEARTGDHWRWHNFARLMGRHPDLKTCDRLVLRVAADYADDRSGEFWPSYAELSDLAGVGDSYLTQVMRRLKLVGAVVEVKPAANGTPARYRLDESALQTLPAGTPGRSERSATSTPPGRSGVRPHIAAEYDLRSQRSATGTRQRTRQGTRGAGGAVGWRPASEVEDGDAELRRLGLLPDDDGGEARLRRLGL